MSKSQFAGWALLLSLLVSNCKNEEPPATQRAAEVKTDSVNIATAPKPKVKFPENWSYLERKFMPQAKLHGKFFDNRIQFHIVKNPSLTLFRTMVSELTFYHIDEELAKKKFMLQGDISSDLMETYGNFKLRPLDSLTKAIAKGEPIISRVGKRRVLNDGLRHYEIRWEKPNKTIRYRVSADTVGRQIYELSEEIPDYSLLFNSVEYGISQVEPVDEEG